MGCTGLTRYATVALIGIAISCGAQAQITKCVDGQGNVTYTDASEGNCRNAVVVEIAETAPVAEIVPPAATTSQSASARTAMLLMTGNGATPVAPSGWANRTVARSHASPDGATVAAARDALSATDRALIAMRTPKLASSR